MSYDYETQKPRLLTPEGQKMLFQIRNRAVSLINQSGAVRLDEATKGIGISSWDQIACMDYLVQDSKSFATHLDEFIVSEAIFL